MKIDVPEKILRLLMLLLIVITSLLSLSFPAGSRPYPFLLLFAIAYWQRERLRNFFQKIKNPQVRCALYPITGRLGAILLEFTSGRLPFNPKPIANLVIGLGFYLPYFAIFLKFINHYRFNLLEVFYLSGLGRLIFDFLATYKILTTAAVTTSPLATLLVVVIQALFTLVIFGVLTALPALCLGGQENKNYNKPLKQYLVSLTPNFLTSGFGRRVVGGKVDGEGE